MTTKRTPDPAGLLGDHVRVEIDGAPDDLRSTAKLISVLSPASRIEALRRHPELIELADSLAARLVGPRKRADMHLMHDIAQAEHRALYLAAAPSSIRDRARQAGTRKPRETVPGLQDWIAKQVQRRTGETAHDLWNRAPEEFTEAIGFDRFRKRVSRARKEAGLGRK